MVACQPVARDLTGASHSGLTAQPRGNLIDMLWLLVSLSAWTLLALLTAPAVGRVLALDGRPPRRRPVRYQHVVRFH